jgi:hypothetical protein
MMGWRKAAKHPGYLNFADTGGLDYLDPFDRLGQRRRGRSGNRAAFGGS